MLKPVLVILTIGSGGVPHVSFSALESLDACTARTEAVTSILTGAGYEIVAHGCGETDLAIAPYQHGAPQQEPTHPYRISIGEDVQIEALAALDDCTPALDADPAVWCALSRQGVE
ncbi:MAG: hypothetical protein Q4G24_02875 [Paracoccus sp. (in: a-proteobacteria)]|uniref:hypothetical protein n=1 Tax=Paracoccus sp. TaxID=267 RepID=UPI0026E056A2|nr:hypothetical protein [Paracoccus sp. (in: a-proteobacteria)]MDO5620394.1 hypothetical protein [Paracoccus sp. (in: a-proteobacteria)]